MREGVGLLCTCWTGNTHVWAGMARQLRGLLPPDQKGVVRAGLMGREAACTGLIADGQFRIELQQGNAPLFSYHR
jgi:hypothetical protein